MGAGVVSVRSYPASVRLHPLDAAFYLLVVSQPLPSLLPSMGCSRSVHRGLPLRRDAVLGRAASAGTALLRTVGISVRRRFRCFSHIRTIQTPFRSSHMRPSVQFSTLYGESVLNRTSPTQSPEPTSPSVTPRADARGALAGLVAHL